MLRAWLGLLLDVEVSYHFEEKALRDVYVGRQPCLHDSDIDWSEGADDRRGADSTDDLRGEQHQSSPWRQGARNYHPQRDGRVEQATADAVQHPGGDKQAEAVAERDANNGLIGVLAVWSKLRS